MTPCRRQLRGTGWRSSGGRGLRSVGEQSVQRLLQACLRGWAGSLVILRRGELGDEVVELGEVASQGLLLELRNRPGVRRRGRKLLGLFAGNSWPGQVHGGVADVRAVQANVVLRHGSSDDSGPLDAHTVEAATLAPRTRSSPWIRRYPQLGFSLARRRTRTRTDRMMRGRPGRFGRDILAWRRRSRSRCQRRMVSGRTSRRSLRKIWRGSRCRRAASNALSAGLKRTLVSPSWRCSTATWWRNARISMSLSRLLIGSRRTMANVLVRPR